MRIIFLGSGAFALPTLRGLADGPHEIALVITQPARPSGRGRHITRTPVHAVAEELGLETLAVENVNDESIVQRITETEARLGIVVAFGQKIGPAVLGTMPGGCINLHASLLPKFRGAAPINWAIIRGEERTGCSVFRLIGRLDAGPMLASRWTDIKPEETAGELHDRLADIGVDAIGAALELYDNDALPEGTPQDDSLATSAPKLSKSDGSVDFHRLAAEVVGHILGVTPWPGAAARYDSTEGRWEKLLITRARRAESPSELTAPPGTVDDRRYVATTDGFVEILEVKPSSGRTMPWSDYVNGRHVTPGDTFSAPDNEAR